MIEDHPVVTVDVEKFYQSYADAIMSQDDARAVTHYHEDVVVRVPGRSEFGGEVSGREQVLAAIEALHVEIVKRHVTLVERFVGPDGFALILDERRRETTPDGPAFRRAHIYRLRGDRIAEIDVLAGTGTDQAWSTMWL